MPKKGVVREEGSKAQLEGKALESKRDLISNYRRKRRDADICRFA